jgi:hypothetical protein
MYGNPVPQAKCVWGTPGFDPAASKTFQALPNVSFNITYGSGDFVAGPVGFDTVSVGGLSVTHQRMLLVTHQGIGDPTVAAWDGDGINTSVLVRLSSLII